MKAKLTLIYLLIGFSFFPVLAEKSAGAMTENKLIAQGSSSEIEMLNERINNNPNDAEAFQKRGAIYAYNEDYQKALEDYNEALNLDPNNALSYNYRGTAYYWLLNYQQALADYNQAIRLNPDLAVAYYNRGYVHQKLKDIPSAINDFQQGADLSLKQGDTQSYQEALEMIKNLQNGKI
ncbi:tetratricopeptide repeat protein [Gloeothece verrucosa]|uniref:TPR repeat-containing protein n=1 Tax=Gloeothece verrucosa (strain PCC 7822) TaxID=497965 RepID=E0UDZ7_GLOV7|nr:tetratricopeptide repeat protein [Gloeothece verrucosa]ADN13001.1 TPR repeat-containing protein [Gloeothece verrucosa PCC 7822]